jgi:hypothetical protein
MKHVFLLVTPSLIKPVCSSVDVVGYLPGLSASPTTEAKQSSRSQTGSVQLSASRQTYYQDERFELHAEMQRGTAKLDTSMQCPFFFLRERSPGPQTLPPPQLSPGSASEAVESEGQTP